MDGLPILTAHLAAAAASALACVATLIELQWFELLFDSAPDGGGGTLERWEALGVSAAAFVRFAWLARRAMPGASLQQIKA